MRRSNLFFFLLIPFLAAFSFGQSPFPASAASKLARMSSTSRTVSLPLVFEANRGQADGGVDFIAQVRGYRAGIGASRVILGLNRASGDAVVMKLAGANQQARARGEEKLPGHSNYLFGTDPSKWITGVEQYAKVRYRDVYPGIDLLFHGSQNRLEQDFVVRPGASPKRIHLYFQGVQQMELTSDGALVLRAGDEAVKMQSLRAYQVVRDREVEVPVRYELRNAQASFRLGSYDRRRALIIDPVLVFATFLGGANAVAAAGLAGVNQAVMSMAADASGVYITGPTISTTFPVTSGVVGPNPQSTFVSKLDPTGQSLIFSTYLAGFGGGPGALTVDSSENIYIAGGAAKGLPIPSGSQPFQSGIHGALNLAILKLNSTGTAVLAATYLGGSGGDYFNGIAIDSSENVYVAGQTTSNDFPLQHPLQGSLGTSGSNAFVTKLNPTLSGLVYSTYLGGNSSVGTGGNTVAHGIALDSSGDAYVIGLANAGFPTTSGAYQPTCPVNQEGTSIPDSCAFLAKLNANDSALLYATYLGDSSGAGGATETPTAVAVDSAEDAYIAGLTYSASFPVVNPIQSCSTIEGNGSNNDPSGNFLSEFNSAGALTFSTCLGINQSYDGLTIYASLPVLTLDAAGDAYFGASAQSGLPLEKPIDANEPAQARPFVSEISADTHTLLFSSFVAGPVTYNNLFDGPGDQINAIAVDSSENIYLAGSSAAGSSYSPGYPYFPVFNPLQAYFFNPGGCPAEPDTKPLCIYTNGFIMKVAPSAGAAAASVPAELQFPTTNVGSKSAPLGTTIYDLGTDALTVSNVAASGDFAVHSNSCGTVPASGGSCAIQVTFTPTAMGTQNGTLTITDSSAGSPHRVTLTGLGATVLTVSPTQLTFASQATGTTSPPQTVTLTAGVDAVDISRIQVSGDFSETNTCGSRLAAGAKCYIQVSFTPKTAAFHPGTSRLWMWAFLIAGWIILPSGRSTKRWARRYLPLLALLPLVFLLSCSGSSTNGPTALGTLTITDSAPNSPQTVSLSGT